MRRRGPDKYGANKYENAHMDTQAFAQAYGGGRADHQRQAAEEAYYRSHPNNHHANSHSSQISHVWQTLEQHKAFLKADPNFEKSIHDQINAIAESRLEHEAQLKELDERLAHYSSTLGFPLRKSGHNPQGPPMNRDIAAKRSKSGGLLVFFRSRPLGFEADYRTVPFRVVRVWRPDLSYLGITAGMAIDGINGVRPSREAIESAEAPLTLHFANPPPSEKPNTASKALPITETISALGRSDAVGEDEKSEKPKEQTITRTITTPDREEPPRDSEISAADTAVLHPKLNLEQFSTRELGKLYGRAYGRYLEYQVLPWSKEIDTEKERLKMLMGRIRILLEKYSVVLEKEIQQSPHSVTRSKSEKSGKIEEIDRERHQESEKRDVAKSNTSNPEAAKEDENLELENTTAKLQADLTRLTETLEDLKTEINANNSTIHNSSKMEEPI